MLSQPSLFTWGSEGTGNDPTPGSGPALWGGGPLTLPEGPSPAGFLAALCWEGRLYRGFSLNNHWACLSQGRGRKREFHPF